MIFKIFLYLILIYLEILTILILLALSLCVFSAMDRMIKRVLRDVLGLQLYPLKTLLPSQNRATLKTMKQTSQLPKQTWTRSISTRMLGLLRAYSFHALTDSIFIAISIWSKRKIWMNLEILLKEWIFLSRTRSIPSKGEKRWN